MQLWNLSEENTTRKRLEGSCCPISPFTNRLRKKFKGCRLPPPTRSLMHIMEIKVMARQLGVESVQLDKSRFRLAFPPDRQVSPVDIQRMVEKCSTQLDFDLGEKLHIEVQVQGRDELERLEKARDTLEELL